MTNGKQWAHAVLGTILMCMLIFALSCVIGCGKNKTNSKTGIFTASPVSGLLYEGDTISGTTGSDGSFRYHQGDEVSFYIGDLFLGTATGDSMLSPVDLVSDASDPSNATANNICVLLQTLDQDGDLNNGIQISESIADVVSGYADLIFFDQSTADFASNTSVLELVADLNDADLFTDLDPRVRPLQSASEAYEHLVRTLAERVVVDTQYGQIRGYDAVDNPKGSGEGMWQFIGIPYAKPPVGDLRWAPPQPPEAWSGIREAVAWRNQSPQNPNMEPNGHGGMSEDCLYLNITAPKTADNLPVMVWFHGGGFRHFSGNQWDFNNASGMPVKDVVLVTLTHRLGSIGYMAHPLLTEESGYSGSGNYGQMDLISALTWVRDNISGFGGDPDNVTIFGQSGGGAKVASLMASPLAQGLFHRAICQSGGVSSIPREMPLEDAEDLGSDLFEALGVETLAEAREKTWLEVVMAAEPNIPLFAPNIDGHYMPDSMEVTIKNGLPSDVPFLAGRTSGDLGGTGPDFAEQMQWRYDNNQAPQFTYKWSKTASGWQERGILSGHTCDLSYLFNYPLTHAYYYLFNFVIDPATGEPPLVGDVNNNGLMWYEGDLLDIFLDAGWNSIDDATSEMTRTVWANFARTGNPSTDEFTWPPYTSSNDNYVDIDDSLSVQSNLTEGW